MQQRRLVQSRLPKAWSCRHWSAPFFVPWNSNVTNSYVNSYGVGAMQTPNGLIRNWFLNQFGRAYIQMSKTPNELLMCGWRLFGFKVSQTPNGLLRNWFLNQFGRDYIQMSITPNELLMCGWRLFGFKVSQTPIELPLVRQSLWPKTGVGLKMKATNCYWTPTKLLALTAKSNVCRLPRNCYATAMGNSWLTPILLQLLSASCLWTPVGRLCHS